MDTALAAAHIVEDMDTAAHLLDTQVVAVVVGILADMAHMVAAVAVGSTVVVAAVDLPLMMQARRYLYPLKLL